MFALRSRSFRALMLVITLLLLNAGTVVSRTQSINKIAVIVDNSGSFRSRYGDAIGKAVGFLNNLAKSARGSASDQVMVISLDAIPEAIWSGTVEELRSKNSSFWTSRFNSRKDYAQCTDVTAAFKLAARYLLGSRSDRRIVMAFSDLTHEPAGSSITKPKSRSIMPPDDFPWGSFRDISVKVFWIPASHILHWQRSAQKHGLSDFKLYTPSESANVSIKLPDRAKRKYTEEERKEAIRKYRRYAKYILGTAGIFVVAIIALLVTAVLLLRRRRNRLQQNAGNLSPNNRSTATRNSTR